LSAAPLHDRREHAAGFHRDLARCLWFPPQPGVCWVTLVLLEWLVTCVADQDLAFGFAWLKFVVHTEDLQLHICANNLDSLSLAIANPALFAFCLNCWKPQGSIGIHRSAMSLRLT